MLHTFFIHLRQITRARSWWTKAKSFWSAKVRSCWWARFRSWWDSIRARSERSSYWKSCRSSNGAYHGAIFDNYILKIVWCLRPVVDLFTGDKLTGDWCLGMWVNFQWSWVAFLCCTYLVRATVKFSRFVTEASSTSTSTTLIQPRCISSNSPTTILAWLRNRDVVQFHLVVLILYLPLHSSGMNVSKPGRMMGETNSLDLVDLEFLFKLDLDRFG